jgi:hypothetical protein
MYGALQGYDACWSTTEAHKAHKCPPPHSCSHTYTFTHLHHHTHSPSPTLNKIEKLDRTGCTLSHPPPSALSVTTTCQPQTTATYEPCRPHTPAGRCAHRGRAATSQFGKTVHAACSPAAAAARHMLTRLPWVWWITAQAGHGRAAAA